MKRIIVLLLVLLAFCISNASALVYDLPEDIHSTGVGLSDDSLLYTENINGTGEIYLLYTDTGSISLKVTGLPDVADVYGYDNRIIFALKNGNVYQTSKNVGLLNFSYQPDYDNHFLMLGSVSSTSRDRSMAIHEDGTIYVTDGTSIKGLMPPTYSEFTLCTYSAYGLDSNDGSQFRAIWPHPSGGVVAGTGTSTWYGNSDKNYIEAHLMIAYDMETVTMLEDHRARTWMGTTTRTVHQAVSADSKGTVYSHYRGNSVSRLYAHELNTSTGEYEKHTMSDGMPNSVDMSAGDVIFFAEPSQITTYNTLDNVPGYTGEPIPPTSANITWDVGTGGTYTAGDVATINYSITAMDSSKDYTIQAKTGSGTIKQTYDISSSSGSVSYSFPVDALPGSYFAGIYEGDTKLDGDHCYLENPTYNYNIGFSKEQYSPGEWVVINYEGLTPEMDLILANDDAFDDSDILQNWTKSGDGQVSYHLSDDYAQDGINLILKLNGEVLQQDYADVVTQDTNLLYGTVYDSATGSRIENAHVNVGGTVVITDSDGKYNYMTATGTYDVTVSKDGYLPVDQYVVIEGMTKRDFFLTPETGSSDIYGTVRDQDTGDPIPQATIFISGPSYGASTFTSGTGYFSLDGLTPDQEYSISATAQGYESYLSTFTATNNSTDLSFSMYLTGTGGSGSDTDQPTIEDHREAAKKTLYDTYGIIPSVFTLVIFFLIFQIITRGME